MGSGPAHPRGSAARRREATARPAVVPGDGGVAAAMERVFRARGASAARSRALSRRSRCSDVRRNHAQAFAEPRIQNALPRTQCRSCARVARPGDAAEPSRPSVPPTTSWTARRTSSGARWRGSIADRSADPPRARPAPAIPATERRRRAAAGAAQSRAALLRYYAHLLLGRAQVARGRADLARTAPSKRRPSCIPTRSRRASRSASSHATRAIGRGAVASSCPLTLRPDAPDRQDPWWTFNWTHAPNADELLALLRQRWIR